LGIEDAEHEETAPDAHTLLVSRLTCSPAGKTQTIKLVPGSLVHRAYGREEATEQFACSYGLNPQFQHRFEKGGLKITGVDPDGEARVVEMSDHTFYMATLFLPQISSQPANPHPLITAYVKAAFSFRSR
jgi:CTP synthase (UTP-ammonia lyase)